MDILVIHLIRLTLMPMLHIHLTPAIPVIPVIPVILATLRMWYRGQSGTAISSV